MQEIDKRIPKDASECVFCSILHNEPEKIIYEDDTVFGFYDIRRKFATEHILVCPKEHIQDADHLTSKDKDLLQQMQKACEDLLSKLTPDSKYRFGYHLPPMNSIGHLHIHGITLPIKGDYLDRVIYGSKLASTEKVIEKIKNRSSQKKVTDFFSAKIGQNTASQAKKTAKKSK